jgi:hypothetical protein
MHLEYDGAGLGIFAAEEYDAILMGGITFGTAKGLRGLTRSRRQFIKGR